MDNQNAGMQERKQSELETILQGFRTQIERMAGNTVKLTGIANRLKDETNSLQEKSPGTVPSPDLPGNISYLKSCIEEFIQLNVKQESQLQKLDNII